MRTLESTKTRKVKSIEVKMSNMTFIITCHAHYILGFNGGWSKNKYTAVIKNNFQGIGTRGNLKAIRSQMELINSRPDLFLK